MEHRTYQQGDKVTVTRKGRNGSVSVWHGEITRVAPDGGFHLRGHTAAGEPSSSWFSPAAQLKDLYGCIQTVTPWSVPE